ncbi:MAG: hypothetical protein ACRDLP_07830, partial [Solirubrobacteraceae bacterium]
NEIDGRPCSGPLRRRTAAAEAVIIRVGNEHQARRRRRHLLNPIAIDRGDLEEGAPAARRTVGWVGRQQRH